MCKSPQAVYVQSHYMDWIHLQKQIKGGENVPNVVQGEKVHKIHPGVQVKVFDLRQCFHLMKEQVQLSQGETNPISNFFIEIMVMAVKIMRNSFEICPVK